MGKRHYKKPITEVLSFASILTEATIEMGSVEEEFGNAKEQDYDFDDWSVDPWEDHIWQEEEKTDIWND